MFPLTVSAWKSSFPYCLLYFMIVLVHFMQMVLSHRSQEKSLSFIVHFWVPHHWLTCTVSSCISVSFLFSFILKTQNNFSPLYPQWIFFPDLIYDLRNYAFPKETLKFLKKNRLFHSYHQKDNSPQEHPSLAHACSWEQVFSRSFQVPATALS